MIVPPTTRFQLTNNFVAKSALFGQISKQMKSTRNMLQWNASLINPTKRPNLFLSPQSVKHVISSTLLGANINIQA